MFGQSLPAQTQAFQQGNMGAQQQILAGLPLAQAAILGGQIDYSALQPYQAQMPDLGFFQQTLPPIQQQQAEEARMSEHRAQAAEGARLAELQRPAQHQRMLDSINYLAGLGQQQQQPQLGDISGGFMSKLLRGIR